MLKMILASLIVFLSFAVLCGLALIYFIFLGGMKNPPLRQTRIAIGSAVFGVEVASTTLERQRGLSGRDSLAEGTGMLFIFDEFDTYGFWMPDMKFPLDMVWISGGRVAGFSENVPPEPGVPLWKLKIYYPPQAVDKVLEINAGDVKRYGIKAGDLVSVTQP